MKQNLLDLYIISKNNNLNYEEQLSLYCSNKEVIDVSLKECLKCAFVVIASDFIINIFIKILLEKKFTRK